MQLNRDYHPFRHKSVESTRFPAGRRRDQTSRYVQRAIQRLKRSLIRRLSDSAGARTLQFITPLSLMRLGSLGGKPPSTA
jgi:hypothetical protein